MLDSLVRVSRRVAEDHYASILAEARSSVQTGGIAPKAITLPEEEPHSLGLYPTVKTDAGPINGKCTGTEAPADHHWSSLVSSASLSTISRTF